MTSLLTVPLVQAGGPSYYADFETSRWEVSGSVFECSLSQHIPYYGEAVFYRQAGEPLFFYLQALESEMAAGRALLTSAAPAWRQGVPEKDIGYVDVQRSNRPVSLDITQTRIVMAELARGMMPTLTRRAWYSDEESIRVGVSPVNFRNAYGQYQECMADLLPVNFSQIERSTVFWRPTQMELDAQSRTLLDNIIAYAKADPGVYSFQINGFTDTAGTSGENLEASRLRAFAVHQYLVRNGIDEAMLETRYFGETEEYLIVRNERTAADRDRNRRVTILMLRR
ncbi:MAG: OmpA family protein [Gammaproteobacteria bacterium]|nr:OmpA family protein [Gammaproteobacteria bacterium]MDP2140404.1 OmpA family protein [Gammaproteobacteria bacterium]MDP2349443.1 OmpA family protein [Gammaproteobacteria bacterium]